MAAFITADTCPACGHVHGQPADWPTCPEHGHWLYVLRGPLATKDNPHGGGWTYACHAHKCTYTHTQKEKAIMTTDTSAALAIREGQGFWNAKQLAALTQLGVDGASNGDLGVFLHRCQVTGLDPFAGQISMVRRGGRWVIQTGIDGYRVIAHRAAKREGVTLSYGPTKWYDRAGGAHEIWFGDEPPAGASVTVYKDGKAFPGVARFKSFAATAKDGSLMAQWAVMPDHMIAKCAEAQALRKAFPHDLESIVTSDETAHPAPAPQVTVQAEASPSRAELPPDREPEPEERYARPVPRIARGDMTALREAIGAQFDALDITDEEEREVYVCKLANRDPAKGVQQLSERDMRFALDSLATCTDLAALVELCNPGDTA